MVSLHRCKGTLLSHLCWVAPLCKSQYSLQQGFESLSSLCYGISISPRLRKNCTQIPFLSGFDHKFSLGPEKHFSTKVSLKLLCSHGKFQFQLNQHFLMEKKNNQKPIQSVLDKFTNIYPKRDPHGRLLFHYQDVWVRLWVFKLYPAIFFLI